MSSSALSVLHPGTVFHGRYRVIRCIKAGGMGAVYEVADEKTNKRRALKVMLANALEDPDFRRRFEEEAKITGIVESDHIVHVSDTGVDEATGTPFLVMDLLRGKELAALVRERGALPPEEVVTYLHQAALALDKTHAARIVHRDLKPENLFVTTRDDGSPSVKILDFGIAKVVSQTADASSTRALGTPVYMAPEQIRGEKTLGPKTDIYALGQVAYTLLVGEAYWAEEKQENDSLFMLLGRIVAGAEEPPVARALRRKGVALPPGFDAWFAKATSTDPRERFDRATAAIAGLAEAFSVPAPRGSLASISSVAAAPPAAAPGVSASQAGAAPGGSAPSGSSGSVAVASGPVGSGSTTGGIAGMTGAPAAAPTRGRSKAAVILGAAALVIAIGAFATIRILSSPADSGSGGAAVTSTPGREAAIAPTVVPSNATATATSSAPVATTSASSSAVPSAAPPKPPAPAPMGTGTVPKSTVTAPPTAEPPKKDPPAATAPTSPWSIP